MIWKTQLTNEKGAPGVQLTKKSTQNILQKVTYDLRYNTIFTLDLSSLANVARYYQRERRAMKHAKQLFSIALQELIEIGEKARKQREKRERAKHGALPRKPGACMHVACKEKQAKQLKLQLK